MKLASDIVEWGKIKPYFDKFYNFNSIDIETVENELFLIGSVVDNKYSYVLSNFFDNFHKILIKSLQNNRDILTWSRYDNTHLVKLLLSKIDDKNLINQILLRIGKVSPIYEYQYKNFTIKIENIIKDSIIFSVKSSYGDKWKRVIIYNLKNLYHTDLLKTAKNYGFDYYSKMGIEYHIIDKERFKVDKEYFKGVIESNRLDNIILIDIANKMLEDFRTITGVYPKSIFTAGSIARSYLLAYTTNNTDFDFKLQFTANFYKSKKRDRLLDYAMRSYHGGKIESYVLGYIPEAKVIDISSAYPYAMSLLPKITGKYKEVKGSKGLENYFYAYIRCNIFIRDKNLIHPLIVPSPINKSNISPYGYIKDIVITKVEYDYLIKRNIDIEIIDYFGLESDNDIYPYNDLVNELFESRMLNNKSNKSLAELYKTILNSLYGITYELTDVYHEDEKGNINWLGYRAGDYFNPVIASYITAITRTYLSEVSQNIIDNGGKVFLNMTDSIIYNGNVTLDVFSDIKRLGTFEPPELVKDVIILGAGRYEYQSMLNERYVIKSRGFSVSVRDKAFYKDIELNSDIKLKHRTFVTSYKATQKYGYNKMGHLIDDEYSFNPFNLGGKRIILDRNINLNKSYTDTIPVYLDKSLYDNV